MLAHQTDETSYINEMLVRMAERLEVDACTLYRFDKVHKELEIVGSWGLAEATLGYRMSLDRGLTGKVAREKRPVSAKYPAQHPDFFYVPGSEEERFKSYLGFPLLARGTMFGVLVIQTLAPKIFMLSDIEQMHVVGREVIRWLRGIPTDS